MDFLYNLFWFPINSSVFLINVGLWGLVGYLTYEAILRYKNKK